MHPTLWARIVTWFFTTFTASSIKDKVHFLSGIQYLYDWIDPDQLEIPAFVLEYDMKVNTVTSLFVRFYLNKNCYRIKGWKYWLEQFSTERRKTKSKVVTLANHKRRKTI